MLILLENGLRGTRILDGVPSDDLCKILHEVQRMARVQNGVEILPKISTGGDRIHERYRQTDRQTTEICDSKYPNVTYSHLWVKPVKTNISFHRPRKVGLLKTRVLGPQFGETVYISEVNGARRSNLMRR